MIEVIQGDCLTYIKELAEHGLLVDSIVTDPPYGIGFMGKDWDKPNNIAFRPDTWATIATVLKPGGYLLAFGGSRTFHRLVCAIEDSGLIIQDTILWLYGTGWPKGKTQLKPAFEPICVAYKPGKRELQIDECRIGPAIPQTPGGLHRGSGNTVGCYTGEHIHNDEPKGRWPANVCHDGSEEVLEAFAKFGEKPTGAVKPYQEHHENVSSYHFNRQKTFTKDKDTGTAARFFYCAKASQEERNGSKHPTIKPLKLMQWLVPLVTPEGGIVLDPFAGSGSTGIAAQQTGRDAILIELDEQNVADIHSRLAKSTC